MHAAFKRLDHRPWPLPAGRWRWRQSWCDLLFAHWPVEKAALRRLVPDGLEIQDFAGSSWVGVVPFRMSGVMRRPLPDLPGLSAFLELNVRLYVARDGKPGVWFLSLDASNRLAVWAARRFFHLPYWHARMSFARTGEGFRFQSDRIGSSRAVRCVADYRPTSPPFEARPGTLEHFLTERYCLYAQDAGGELYRCEIHHVPWPLQPAVGHVRTDELLGSHGLDVGSASPLLHFSRGVDAIVWSLQRLTGK